MDKIQHKDKELDYLTRSLLHHPSPYIIYELDGSIAWANMAAIYIFELDQLNEISIKKIDDEIKNNFGDLDSIALRYTNRNLIEKNIFLYENKGSYDSND